MLIPDTMLIAATAFGQRLSADAVAAGLARGLRTGGAPVPDVCLLEADERPQGDPRAHLDSIGFDVRMRRARAVVIAAERLQERTLTGSMTFEIATRARQAGVPSYAITAVNLLEEFDARILDLQLVIEARTPRALRAAGERLAALG